VVFEVKAAVPEAGDGAGTLATQFEKSAFFVPR
jgi:hypothetical protein